MVRRSATTKGPRRRGAGAPARRGPPLAREPVTVVGIGASAGGLEALEQFLGQVPEGTGLAFVVVQHLDPDRKGAMPELLQRVTAMRVAQVKDRTRVLPGCVYVIPPNKDLSILGGVLHLLEPLSPRGLRLPVDLFLRALADDQRERSVGVILSGMGTDGTLGVTRIKEQGGLVLVQDPESAKFDSMPRSAIGTGLVDVVAPAAELPRRLLEVLRRVARPQLTGSLPEPHAHAALEKAVIVLRARFGHDFSQYKKSTLQRRVERRMALHQIEKVATYLRYLQENPQEQELLFNELLIGVTSFFRDPAAWARLRDKALPALISERPGGGVLRAWVAGCSTGEEAYSLAMVFKEALAKARPHARFSLQIFATDLDRNAVEVARRGVYPTNITADVSPERLRRFFVRGEGGGHQVAREIREMVTLAPHDIIKDAPFTRLDLLLCRNLLIYLEAELQRRLVPLFHYSLRPGGLLFLGSSETVGVQNGLFEVLDAKLRIYRRKETSARPGQVEFPTALLSHGFGRSPAAVEQAKPVADLQALVDGLVLRQFSPAAVLATEGGELLYFSGRTGKYLEPPAGKANWNLFAMAGEGLLPGLRAAFKRAARQKRAVTARGLAVQQDGHSRGVDVTVVRVKEPESLRGTFLVVFHDLPTPAGAGPAKRGRAADGRRLHADLNREIRGLQQELQSTREDMQSSQEELRSANEELQSTNEELQSTNEELTTSKEEMQSMNEELQTVNGELQAKVDELSRTNNDMKNLLDSTDIATLFLDGALRVRRFTAQTTRLMKLIPGDVGRPVTDLASDLLYPGLGEDVREVLRTLAFREKEITTADGRWYSARIMPYRTLQDVIDGVVMTFTEITGAKLQEAELRSSRARVANLLGALPPGVSIVDGAGKVVPRSVALTSVAGAGGQDFSGWRLVLARDGDRGREVPP